MSDVAVVVEPSATPEVTQNFEPETFTPAQHTEWMKTGKVPDVKPAADPSPAAKEVVASESATEPQQEEKELGKAGQARIRELAAEVKELKAKLAPPAVKTESAPVKAAKAAPMPVFGEKGHEDETFGDFEARKLEHVVQTALATDRAEREKERVEASTAAAKKAVEDAWSERVTAAAGELKMSVDEFKAKAFSKDVPISDTMDQFILDSDIGPKVLHYFADHVDEAKAIASMPAWKAARALIAIEQSLSATEAPEKKVAPVVPITKAARPAPDLNAKGGAPVDELKAAIEADDFSRFNEIQNQKLLARRRG